jgi:drug/metabolite transporter (DMT)-like permease
MGCPTAPAGYAAAMSRDRTQLAILIRLGSVLLFATMGLLAKLAEARGATLFEILFWRQFASAILVAILLAGGPGLASVRTSRFGAHVIRTVVGQTSMCFVFGAIVMLPLAESTTIGFCMPIFATVLGALVLKEPTGWRRWLAVGVGFLGIVIVAQPGSGHIPIAGALIGLTGAFLTAVVSILLRQIGRTEAPTTTVFWFSLLSLVPLAPAYAMVARWHDGMTFAILIGVGLFGGAAQVAITSSLRFGRVSTVVPFDYTAILWATLFGWLAFDRLPTPATWIGAPIIVASGLYIVWRERTRHVQEVRQALEAPVD